MRLPFTTNNHWLSCSEATWATLRLPSPTNKSLDVMLWGYSNDIEAVLANQTSLLKRNKSQSTSAKSMYEPYCGKALYSEASRMQTLPTNVQMYKRTSPNKTPQRMNVSQMRVKGHASRLNLHSHVTHLPPLTTIQHHKASRI